MTEIALLNGALLIAAYGAAWLVNLPNNTTTVHVADGKDPVRHAEDRGDARGEADRSK